MLAGVGSAPVAPTAVIRRAAAPEAADPAVAAPAGPFGSRAWSPSAGLESGAPVEATLQRRVASDPRSAVSAARADMLVHDLVAAVASRSPATGLDRRIARSPEGAPSGSRRQRSGRVSPLLRAFETRSDAAGRPGSGQYSFGDSGLAVGPGASPLTVGAVGQLISARSVASGDGDGHKIRRMLGRHRIGQPGGGQSGGQSGGGPSNGGTATDTSGPGGANRLPADYVSQLPPAVARLLPGQGGPSGPGADHSGGDSSASNGGGSPARGGWVSGAVPSGPRRDGGPVIANRLFGGAMPANGATPNHANPPLLDSSSSPISAETLDWIVEAVEERILAELERRGMRFQPGVF